METLQHIISQKHELLARETFSRKIINYSEDMPADQKDRYIHYLVDKVNELDLDKRAMELAVEEFQGIHNNVLEQLAELQRSIAEIKTDLHEERGKRKRAEAKVRKLDQQLKYAQKNKFGDKCQKARKDKNKEDETDREDEKDKFDGTDGTISTKSVQENNPIEEHPVKEKKERDVSNRPERYDTMSVEGAPVFHPTDDSKVPGRIIERKSVKVYSFKMCLVEEQFDMVHYVEPGRKPKWGYFPTEGHPEVITKFEGTKATPEFLQALAYEVYEKNVTFGLLHQWLTDMGMTISKNTLHNWLKKGKKYLDKFWDGIFAYQKDGNYPIDNNIAERTIRKLTTQRNNSLHYGSDEGVEMAVAYHSVISTVKLHGMSCCDYLGKFFKKIFNGCRDFLSLTPANIASDCQLSNVKSNTNTLTYSIIVTLKILSVYERK